MFAVGSAVFAAVVVLMLLALFWNRDGREQIPEAEIERRSIALVAVGGVIVPLVVLLTLMGLTVAALASGDQPNDPLVIQVTGNQFFFEAHYPDAGVTTIGEIRFPVGDVVRLDLESRDVIHSFWVPQLAGKRDMIPGQTNSMWIEARTPGTYRGQCAEFCGIRHALMTLLVIVEEDQASFESWLESQRDQQETPPPDDTDAEITLEVTTPARLVFEPEELRAPAGVDVTVEYLNDTAVPHNIHFFDGDGPDAPSIASTDVDTGPGNLQTVTFTTPSEPGEYFFRCDVHPIEMTGTLVVE